jgi:uncharacterized protein YbjQ (UPF0145 family)
VNFQPHPNYRQQLMFAAYDERVLVVTTEALPGYDITAVFGEVIGVTACTRNAFAVGVRNPDGGKGVDIPGLLVQTRARTVAQMVQAAELRGANAIVGMRFDYRDVTNLWMELCAYGTAVLAVPVSEHARRQAAAMRVAAAERHAIAT